MTRDDNEFNTTDPTRFRARMTGEALCHTTGTGHAPQISLRSEDDGLSVDGGIAVVALRCFSPGKGHSPKECGANRKRAEDHNSGIKQRDEPPDIWIF